MKDGEGKLINTFAIDCIWIIQFREIVLIHPILKIE